MNAPDPKVFAVLVTRGYPYVFAVTRLADAVRQHGARLEITQGEPATVNREILATTFHRSDATHLFLVDETVVLPANGLGQLLAADAPVVSGVYPQWVEGRIVASVAGLADPAWAEQAPAGTIPVKRTRLGCLLIRRDVLDAVGRPWFMSGDSSSGTLVSDDAFFCDRARQAGFRLLCDGSVLCANVVNGVNLLALAGPGFARAPEMAR